MHEDIVDKDNNILTPSIWREKRIAAVLLVDKMYGKENNKLLYKCIPYNKNLPIFLVTYENKQGFSKTHKHKYVLLEFKHWNNKHPLGQLVQTFGNVDDLSCLYDYLLFALDIHTSNQRFTKRFMVEYKNDTKQNHLKEMKKRYNLQDRTNYEIYTIDGETTRDFDDGIGLIQHKDKSIFSIYISNPVLWMDYLNLWDYYGDRISSVYLPDRVVNMLPNMMSNKVAGLLEGEIAIAFVMDIQIVSDKIESVDYKNVLIKVKKNYRYEEKKLLKNPMYKTILSLMSSIGMRVENSYKCIEKWMIYFNSKIGETLSQYNRGVYRYCKVLKTNHKTIPLPLIDYISWGETNSGYSLYDKDLAHLVLGVSYYAQMSSPIRRIVDILNMIEMQDQTGMCTLSTNTINYKNNWLTKIEDINNTIRSIKRLEYDTKLLKYYLTTENVTDRVYEGYIVAILDEKIFKVFIPELEVSTILKNIQPMALYTKIQCRLCLLQDEVNIVQKIRLNVI